ncbi:MAG: hypothetical protein LBU86_00430, partial [Oscillospiraceae bacterium]|nr:hypothetical protein [Oscillospiraceae bacterium]
GTEEYQNLQKSEPEGTIDRQADLFARVLLLPPSQFVSAMRDKLRLAGIKVGEAETRNLRTAYMRVFESVGRLFCVTPKKIAQRIFDQDDEIAALNGEYSQLRPIAEKYIDFNDAFDITA